MMTEDATDRVARIRRAFDAAFQRMCEAENPEAAEDELSSVLSQVYRLSEVVKDKLGKGIFYKAMLATNDRRMARAATWARTFDTHDAVVVAEMADIVTDYYTEMYGTLAWRPLDELPKQAGNHDEHLDYAAQLAGHGVLDTVRQAFDTLAAMVCS